MVSLVGVMLRTTPPPPAKVWEGTMHYHGIGGMARRKRKPIDSYSHGEAERVNNPPVGLVTAGTDPDAGSKTYRHADLAAADPPPPADLAPADLATGGHNPPGHAGHQQPGHNPLGHKPAGHNPPGHDPHIDPELSWAQKRERTEFDVPTVSLHVHERIDPRTIIEAVSRGSADAVQGSLFELPSENPPLREAVEFYRHAHNWSNRLIAGDSLLVMNSLLEKEGMGGEVQTVYIDPPYGIKYGSNFQPFTGKRQVTDRKPTDLTREPEMIRAFRDTWELGIHSYLSYLRDRLELARELLGDSGSCFVQIGDENVHRVALLMDEVFGPDNRCATISFATTGGSSTKRLPEVADYLLWYAKSIEQVKYRQLYEQLDRAGIVELFSSYAMVECPDGRTRRLTPEERFDPDGHLPEEARLFKGEQLMSQGYSTTGRSESYEWQGRVYPCPETLHWRVSPAGMDRLADKKRLFTTGTTTLQWKWYEDEVPGRRINNLWHRQMSAYGKRYVVQTAPSVIQRCLLMTSDPGDLVLDPTCGSGTTAYVAEQWGRRWITCDTSRVALAIARQRLMTATFKYYELAHPNEGVDSGFKYRSVSKVSAAILAYDEPERRTTLYDQPEVDRGKHRVTGPFTVEAVPSPRVIDPARAGEFEEPEHPGAQHPPPAGEDSAPADSSVARQGESSRQTRWTDELRQAGIRAKHGQRIRFTRLEPLASQHVHAVGEAASQGWNRPRRAAVVFGPEHAPLEQRRVYRGLEEAAKLVPVPEVLVFAAFAFDPEAAKDIEETNWPGVDLLPVEMNTDLQTDDLKSKRASNETFWLVGRPEVRIDTLDDGRWQAEVLGFDYFDVATGERTSGDAAQIAAWMLDTDYDGRSLFPRQVFFPFDPKKDWQKLKKTLRTSIDPELISAYAGTRSLPFEAGEHQRIAVKIVDDRGIESLVVRDLAGLA